MRKIKGWRGSKVSTCFTLSGVGNLPAAAGVFSKSGMSLERSEIGGAKQVDLLLMFCSVLL
jgi:hypothetical protein